MIKELLLTVIFGSFILSPALATDGNSRSGRKGADSNFLDELESPIGVPFLSCEQNPALALPKDITLAVLDLVADPNSIHSLGLVSKGLFNWANERRLKVFYRRGTTNFNISPEQGEKIRVLDLSRSEKFELRNACKLCNNVTSLNLGNYEILLEEDIGSIIASFPKLLSLHLGGCYRTTGEDLARILDGCRRLKLLSLTSWVQIGHENTEAFFAPVVSSYPNLTSLYLNGCINIEDNDVSRVLSIFPNLYVLNLHFCQQITDISIDAIATNLSRLTTLDLSYNEKFTAGRLAACVERVPGLTFLNIYSCDQITVADLISNVGSFSKLTSLNFGGYGRMMTDTDFSSVVESFQNLTFLGLENCHGFTDAHIADIKALRPLLRVEK